MKNKLNINFKMIVVILFSLLLMAITTGSIGSHKSNLNHQDVNVYVDPSTGENYLIYSEDRPYGSLIMKCNADGSIE